LVRASNPGPMTLDGTNTWVLRAPGAEAAVVVDPGPLERGHLASVAALGPSAGVLTTHSHPDHVEGLPHFREITGAPVLDDGGEYAGLRIVRLATPGHTADSVCFRVSYPDGSEPAVLTGDTILGRGTTIVAWPDGDLGDYWPTWSGNRRVVPRSWTSRDLPGVWDRRRARRTILPPLRVGVACRRDAARGRAAHGHRPVR
jgi:glyoxylase-like metal-dependent hydrolase (beta-lactamase superfamily II)